MTSNNSDWDEIPVKSKACPTCNYVPGETLELDSRADEIREKLMRDYIREALGGSIEDWTGWQTDTMVYELSLAYRKLKMGVTYHEKDHGRPSLWQRLTAYIKQMK